MLTRFGPLNYNASGVSDIPQIADLVLETAGRPVKSLSLFYSLNLLDANMVQRVKLDYNMLQNKLSDGFFYYGLYALVSELSNMGNIEIDVDGDSVRLLEVLDDNKYESEVIIREQVKKWGISNPRLADRILLYLSPELFGFYTEPGQLADRDLLIDAFNILERTVNGITEPFEFAQTMKELFADDRLHINSMAGTFGGEAWSKIAGHLVSKKNTPDVIWIDTSFGIEHNGNGWLDKVTIVDKEVDKVVPLMKEKDITVVREDGFRDLRREKITTIRVNVLRMLLDTKFEGNQEELFDWAVLFTDEIIVNLNRLKRRV